MSTLLGLDASPRGDRSISRALGKRFVEYWQRNNPGGTVLGRDLNATHIPYMDNDWIAGVYAPAEMQRTQEMRSALALSAELVSELLAADTLLISTPMYNFTIPAVLKSWIDYVVRPGYTFRLAPGWPGMLENKKARVIVASRDSYPRSELVESWDQVTPVLRKALSFMGITDIEVVHAGGSLAVNLGKVSLDDHISVHDFAIAALAKC